MKVVYRPRKVRCRDKLQQRLRRRVDVGDLIIRDRLACCGIHQLSAESREIALPLGNSRNSGELIVRIGITSAGPVEEDKCLLVIDYVRNLQWRSYGHAKTILIVICFLVRRCSWSVERVGSSVENRIVGTVED